MPIAIPHPIGLGKFGDGSDGAYTFDGAQATVAGVFTKVSATVYRLDRSCFFESLTISSGVTLNTNGYLLCAQALGGAGAIDWTGASGVNNAGGNAGAGATGAAGGAGGSAGAHSK